MTETTGATTPAGWYPVAPGSTQLRWWDGTKWTEHVHEQAAAQLGGGIPKAPAGTNPNTVWIWILALLPVINFAGLGLVNFKEYFSSIESLRGDTSSSAASSAMVQAFTGSGYLSVIGISFVFYVVAIIFAFLDFRRLKELGVVKPFHWALSFIPSGYGYFVYMIGRFVVVKRRTGTGLAPLWVWIVVYVVGTVVVTAYLLSQIGSIASTFPTS